MLIKRFLRSLMTVASLLAILLTYPIVTQGQDFDEGLQYYRQQDYEKAISIFNQLKNSEAYLFTAKSLYAMGKYPQAQSNLNNINADALSAIYFESIYTSALIDFQLKEFGNALNKLYEVMNSDADVTLSLDSKQIYRQINNYLTAKQRLSALSKANADEIIFDLLESSLGKVNYDEATRIFNAAKSAANEDEWRDKISGIESNLSSAGQYRNNYRPSSNNLRAPNGTIYNVGVALPEYQPKDQEFSIVRSLYFGVRLAVQNFNQNNRNTKVSLHFFDTGTTNEELQSSVKQYFNNYRGDAIIGPLFSEQAEEMVSLASELEIPAIAPLANARINSENSFLFQSNPTFAIHGKEMARYAVRELQMERFAVLAQTASSGASSAQAFRKEAEKLGAEIVYYFEEDLQANEYEISQYTRYFGSKGDSIDAVYAPFTGRLALTLIDLLLADLRKMNTPPAVLGSQEWQKLNFKSAKYGLLDIKFSQGYYLSDQNQQLYRFKNLYQNGFGAEPDQFAMIGFDLATFIFNSLDRIANPELLVSTIRTHPLYRGLVNNIQFNGDNINHAVKIIKVSKTGELITQ